jgi:hypothetical protein
MNIFYLDKDVSRCAEMHNDKHCIKMILEYAQLLSTSHRVIDGTLSVELSNNGRKRKVFRLPDGRDNVLYSATHINHPSAIWVRQSLDNYFWLFDLWIELMKEYTYRYGKNHKCEFLIDTLSFAPDNISSGLFTEPTPAMPDDIKVPGDSIASYRNYYIKNKTHLASWSGKVNSRPIPQWYQNAG